MTVSADVVVVGGGIAGLSAAAQLATDHSVLLLEREAVLAAHASGRNAAIFRPLEPDATTAALTRRSLQLCTATLQESPLSRRGLVLVARDSDALQPLYRHALQHAVAAQWLRGPSLHARVPLLVGGEVEVGLWLADGGVLDIHALTGALAALARARGAQLRTRCALSSVERSRGRVDGVRLDDGTRVATAQVVLAGGAWNLTLGQQIGCPLPLLPMRRHLVQLRATVPPDAPVVWRVDDDEVYLRPEGAGALTSPCDEVRTAPCDPVADPRALELLSGKLARLAPRLADAGVQRSWACLRTFAPDRELVIGPDPRLQGLSWLTGLGGRGMGVGVGAGELLAQTLRGRASEIAAVVSPARLVCA